MPPPPNAGILGIVGVIGGGDDGICAGTSSVRKPESSAGSESK
jgi:hypothetical protein